MTISYGSVTLTHPEEPEEDLEIRISSTVLLSGKTKIQSSTLTGQKYSFKCHVTSLTEITNLIALIGTANTLIIDGTSYTNYYIESFKKTNEGFSNWSYEITFVHDSSL